MGAVEYTSQMAEGAFYESERQRELRHIQKIPLLEKKEVRDLYSAKGAETKK